MSRPRRKPKSEGDDPMRRCSLIIAGIAAISLVNCDGGGAPTVTKGQDRLKVVRFRPQGSAWTESDGVRVEHPDGFVVRKAKGSTELLIAGLTSAGYWARHYGE